MIPAGERPDHISPEVSEGGQSYSIFKFHHPHFGEYRNVYALRAVAALESVLGAGDATVRSDGELQSLHGDNRLFS